jgi:hypothetical protein
MQIKSMCPVSAQQLYCWDGCAKNSTHLSCLESSLKTRSTYGDSLTFCSIACVDIGPLILAYDGEKAAGKLNKMQLKCYLWSKEIQAEN